jgi:F420-0:gamma-glutamyl ligase
LAPASSALLLLLRCGNLFRPATLDECNIEEFEEELEPKLPAASAHVEL